MLELFRFGTGYLVPTTCLCIQNISKSFNCSPDNNLELFQIPSSIKNVIITHNYVFVC